MRRVTIFNGARLASKRFPRKMLSEIGGTSLFRRCLNTMALAGAASSCGVTLAMSPEDFELVNIANEEGVRYIPMSDAASNADCYEDAYSELRDALRPQCDWLIDGNFLCRPFLKVETICAIAEKAKTATRPFVCAIPSRDLLWDENGKQIHGHGQTCDTQRNPLYLRSAHLAYGIPVDMLGDTTAIVKDLEPFSMSLSLEDRIDIDTKDDWRFAQAYLEGINVRNRHATGSEVGTCR